jgi:DNA repair protein RadC
MDSVSSRGPKEASKEHEGHRARLRRRLFRVGADGLEDYEIVEYLLAVAIPRRDTKKLAKQLLEEFGGIERLISADPEAILRIDGVGEGAAAALKIVDAAANRMKAVKIEKRPVLGSWQSLIDYLRTDMAHQARERLRVLFLNSKNMLLANEILSEGSVDETAVYIREILRRALDLHATAIILVHNHPSGDPEPSSQDIRLTHDLVDAARHLKIQVHDHVIIGAKGHTSLKAKGVI